MEAKPISSIRFELGEGPVWDHRERVLRWVDIIGQKICRHVPSTGVTSCSDVGMLVSAVLLGSGRRLVLATESGLATWDEGSGAFGPFINPESDLPNNRFNDAKTSPKGHIHAGTMNQGAAEPVGSLYCFGSDGEPARIASGFCVSNGLGWSPDGSRFYFTDSARREIYVFACDADEQLGERRLFRRFADEEGKPDGLAVDRDGCLWVAFWDGWRVGCYAPDGTHLRDIRLPVPRPTSCAFGGDDLSTLYITTAAVGLERETLEQAPHSGLVLAVEGVAQGMAAIEAHWPLGFESGG